MSDPNENSDLPVAATEVIESYLDELQRSLVLPARQIRRILTEAEDHLREATVAGIAAGEAPENAAAAAVGAFGSSRRVAAGFRPSPFGSIAGLLQPDSIRTLVATAILFVGVGLTAVGISGLLAELLGLVFGIPFVSGDYNGVTYTAARCADFLSYFPDAGGCEQAAALHHFGEVVDQRVLVGVPGVIILIGYLLWSRRTASPKPPAMLVATIGCTVFGLAALVQLLAAITPAVDGGRGVGTPLAGAIVSLAVAAVFIPMFGRALTAARS